MKDFFLLIDTTQSKPFVCSFDEDNRVYVSFFFDTQDLSRVVEKHIIVKDRTPKAIFCCQGPGNFSSLRIGASFCLGLKNAYNVPLIGLDTFYLFLPSTNKNMNFCSVFELGKQGCFFVKGERIGSEISFFGKGEFLLFSDIEAWIKTHQIFNFIGPSLSKLYFYLKDFKKDLIQKCHFEERYPSLFLLQKKLKDLFSDNLNKKLKLNYIKKINEYF